MLLCIHDAIRLLSVTCAEVVVCSLPRKLGASGTSRLTRHSADSPSSLPWPLPHFLHWSSLAATELREPRKSHLSCHLALSLWPRPRTLSPSLRRSMPMPMLRRSPTQGNAGLAKERSEAAGTVNAVARSSCTTKTTASSRHSGTFLVLRPSMFAG